MTNDARVAGMPEGEVTGMIESQTSQIPSSAYLGAAIGSMAVAAVLKAARKRPMGHLCRTMGSAISFVGRVQQDGKTARF
jgi:hypothetical protein